MSVGRHAEPSGVLSAHTSVLQVSGQQVGGQPGSGRPLRSYALPVKCKSVFSMLLCKVDNRSLSLPSVHLDLRLVLQGVQGLPLLRHDQERRVLAANGVTDPLRHLAEQAILRRLLQRTPCDSPKSFQPLEACKITAAASY